MWKINNLVKIPKNKLNIIISKYYNLTFLRIFPN